MQASLEDFFAPKPLVVTLMAVSRSVVASEKYLSFRQSVIITIFFNIMTRTTFPLFKVI